jgi:hypothetical protein
MALPQPGSAPSSIAHLHGRAPSSSMAVPRVLELTAPGQAPLCTPSHSSLPCSARPSACQSTSTVAPFVLPRRPQLFLWCARPISLVLGQLAHGAPCSSALPAGRAPHGVHLPGKSSLFPLPWRVSSSTSGRRLRARPQTVVRPILSPSRGPAIRASPWLPLRPNAQQLLCSFPAHSFLKSPCAQLAQSACRGPSSARCDFLLASTPSRLARL